MVESNSPQVNIGVDIGSKGGSSKVGVGIEFSKLRVGIEFSSLHREAR